MEIRPTGVTRLGPWLTAKPASASVRRRTLWRACVRRRTDWGSDFAARLTGVGRSCKQPERIRPMSSIAKVLLLVALFALGWGTDSSRRQAHGLHDHRQFVRRKGDVSAAPARGPVPVRRAGGARPSRLAGLGLPAGRALRPARHLRPFRRQHRVLFGSGGRAANSCRSRRWSAPPAATPVPDCSRN